MTSRKIVAVVMGTHMTCYREVIRGINGYAAGQATWHIDFHAPFDNFVGLIERSKPDGLLMGLVNQEDEARQAIAHAGATVGVCGQHAQSGLPGLIEVEVDDEAVGAEAARHFLEKGFVHFAFLGTTANWSYTRLDGFRRVVNAAGHDLAIDCHDADATTAGRGWATPHHFERQVEWLRSLPKPLALLACNDLRGRAIAEACRDAGLRVPEEIAILGVDDDDLDCNLSHPPLSSVAIPWRRIGQDAAALLERMMNGEAIAAGQHRVPPIGVVERQSTNVFAIADPDVTAALAYIREHAHEPIGVEDILRVVPTARRSLEKRFRALLGRSPHEEIRRVHVERAKHLLVRSDLPMPDVAARSGFGNPAWFSKAFRDLVGETPMHYRKRFRRH